MSKGGEWFYSQEGQQQGPVTFEELVTLAKSGSLHPRTDLVWGPKMQNWEPAGDVKGLFERKKITAAVPTLAAATAAAPAAESGGLRTGGSAFVAEAEPEAHYNPAYYNELPGVDRGGYFFGTLILPVIAGVIGYFFRNVNEMLPLALAAFTLLVGLFVTIQRFPNLGMSRFWFLGFLVPLLNLWLGYRVFACPPGYAYGRKIDGIGIFLAILYWLGIIVYCVAMVGVMSLAIGGMNDPKVKEQMAPIQQKISEYLQQMETSKQKK